ncbi:MAG: glycosyltransferase family 2 protein, partial [Prevotellaceae bacterium]|nr:glycosyltransferase family 2 protein [Prevotellaceae bacterium]
MKDISIIIPIYNVEKYVAECINSVISQTYDHSKIECIIVDDCTPDHSMDIVNEIIGKYDGEMTLNIIRHEQNQGLSAARNTGI